MNISDKSEEVGAPVATFLIRLKSYNYLFHHKYKTIRLHTKSLRTLLHDK
jgi:hypothetical protein